MTKITAEEIKVFSKYIYEISGIVLDQSKGYLLETRLRPLMREISCKGFSELFHKVKSDASQKLRHKVVDAISTNETFFFRDNTPFDLLRNKIMPDLIDRRRLQYKSMPIPLRIWSAACSSGQEVYSIAITLHEMLPDLRNYNITILGTDISDKIIAQASYGSYSRFEMERGLPKQYLHKYFNQMGNEWRIKDEIRAMAQFNKINLLKPFPDTSKFDIIFCRNVAIYFSQADRQRLIKNLAGTLKLDGALLLGGSESLNGISSPFESRSYLRGIYYQKKDWDKNIEKTLSASQVDLHPKRATRPPKPVQVTPAVRRSKSAPLPTKIDNVPEVVTRPSPERIAPAPVAPLTKEKKVYTQPPQPSEILPTSQKSIPKKSLLSALQENKAAKTSKLSDRQVNAATSAKKNKRTLLDKIAAIRQDKLHAKKKS